MASKGFHITTPTDGVAVTTSLAALTWGAGYGITAVDHIICHSAKAQNLLVRIAAATASLTGILVEGLVHPEDTVWVPLAGAAADFTGGGNRFVDFAGVYTADDVFVDRDLMTIDATQYGVLGLNVPGFAKIRIQAKTTSGTATVTAWAVGYERPSESDRITLAAVLAKQSADPATATLQGPYATALTVSILAPDSTADGKTLATLKGSALSANLKELILWPEDSTADITWVTSGNASGTSPQLPANGIGLPIDKTLADNIKLFCTAGANITMIELG